MTIELNTPACCFKFHFTCYVMTKLAILMDKKKLQLTLIIPKLMLKTERDGRQRYINGAATKYVLWDRP